MWKTLSDWLFTVFNMSRELQEHRDSIRQLEERTRNIEEAIKLLAQEQRPDLFAAYAATPGHPKITYGAKNEAALRRALEECQAVGIPAHLVTDEGRTVFPEPTVTVLGIGPCRRSDLPPFVGKMQLLKD